MPIQMYSAETLPGRFTPVFWGLGRGLGEAPAGVSFEGPQFPEMWWLPASFAGPGSSRFTGVERHDDIPAAAIAAAHAECIPIQEASHHVGETKCVTGKVWRVKAGDRGVHFVDFCEDQAAYLFTVVVFPSNLKDVGDVRRLTGRVIEIRGPVKLYDGRAEIVLSRVQQLTGGTTMIPPLPKEYDVEKSGHYSAGRLRPTKRPKKTKSNPANAPTYGNDVEGDVPPE
jgi:hypothetical protein